MLLLLLRAWSRLGRLLGALRLAWCMFMDRLNRLKRSPAALQPPVQRAGSHTLQLETREPFPRCRIRLMSRCSISKDGATSEKHPSDTMACMACPLAPAAFLL